LGLSLSLGSFVAKDLIERKGRRKLVLFSLFLMSVTLILLGLSYYYIRVSTDIVDYSTEGCDRIDALVWNGVTKYCYDCVEIDGCGFCGGVCTGGKRYFFINYSLFNWINH